MTIPYKFRYHPTTSQCELSDINDLTEHKVMCNNCGLESRFEIILDHRHAFMECVCPVCRKHTLVETFNFSMGYMRKNLPDHELLKQTQNDILNRQPVNTVSVIKFVQNFVEFNKTLE